MQELGEAQAMDPALARRGFYYSRFLEELHSCGVIEIAESVVAEAGIFFVKRKDDKLMLIFDTRVPNTYFADPPGVSLCSGEALAELDFAEVDGQLAHGRQ